MTNHIHACIAFIVGRLVTGKIIVAIYDYSQSRHIEITSLPEAANLSEFSFVDWSYMAGPSKVTTFQYVCSNGHILELRISGTTFIGHLRESSAHFMGNVKGDTIYLYDQKKSAQFSYKLVEGAQEQ